MVLEPVAEDPRKVLEDWLTENISGLSSFDFDENRRISREELDAAIAVARSWAARVGEPGVRWFWAEDREVRGPVEWHELSGLCADRPTTFVNMDMADVWLPYRAILLARNTLAA